MKGPIEDPKDILLGTQLEGGNGGPPPVQKLEMVHPWEMHTTYWDIRNRMGYLPEPSIRNYEIWLDWPACQLDTHTGGQNSLPYPGADPRRLAWKICASFLVQWLDVRPSQAKITPHSLPPNVSPGLGFSPLTLSVKMSNGSPCY